jgi:hypothetical protein
VDRKRKDTDHGQCREAGGQERLKIVAGIEDTGFGFRAKRRFDHRKVEGDALRGTAHHAADDPQSDNQIQQPIDQARCLAR